MSTPIFNNPFQLAQVKPTPIQGMLDSIPNNTFDVRVAQAQTYPLIPGAAVKISHTGFNITEVVAANPGDDIAGFVPLQIRTGGNGYNAGDVFNMADKMSVMWMTAESSFNAGDLLEYDNQTTPTKVQVKLWGGTNTPIGHARTGAAVPGALVKVYLDMLGITPHAPSS